MTAEELPAASVSGDRAVLANARRVWVVGTPGAGKSTLSQALSEHLGASHVQLDGLYWAPGGGAVPEREFLAALAAELSSDRWVVDGQYPAAVKEFAGRADCVVWLDPPAALSWLRLLKRTLRRWVRREVIWGGTRETWWTVLGPRSILWYALRVRREQRAANASLVARLSAAGAVVVHYRGRDAVVLVSADGA